MPRFKYKLDNFLLLFFIMVEQSSREFVYFKIPVFIVDLLIHLSIFFIFAHSLPVSMTTGVHYATGVDKGVMALLVLSYTFSVFIIGLRLHERRIKLRLVLWRAVKQTLCTYLMLTVLLAMVEKIMPRQLIIHSFMSSVILITLWHWLANYLVRQLRKLGHNKRSVVIIGTDVVSQRLYKELGYGKSFTGYVVEGFFTSMDDPELPEGAKLLGAAHESFDWLKNNRVDEVYCSLSPATSKKEVDQIIQLCNDKFMDFFYVPNMDGYPHRQMHFREFGRVNVIKLHEEPMNTPLSKLLRRTVDILVSGLFLCTVYPFVLLFVWIGDKVTGSEGPVYFRQARTGYNGKPFMIYKFRSMKVNKDADKLQATENDPRKTKFGDFLRRSSIDELPQFINVFLGDMSIIGPRPHMEYHTEVYSQLIGDYMVRHLAKPGITGWAQINGCRGETKTVEEMQARVEHDIWYIEHWTPLLDLEIFLKTIWQVMPGHDKQAY